MIIIAPYAQKLRNGNENPKNYPYWQEVINGINHPIIQVGVAGEIPLVDDVRHNLPLSELAKLVKECKTWISVDSFFQHFCWDLKKTGIVLWSKSDPKIFGHPENINLLKDRKYIRPDQFYIWEQCPYDKDAFVDPNEVIKQINNIIG